MTLQILVVDDEELILDLVRRQLSREGHAVTISKDAQQALCAFQESRFDVIISDILMPKLTGIDLLREVRKSDPDVPVILMTGSPQVDSAMSAIELGVFSYLSKPFDLQALAATIQRASRLAQLAKVKRQALELTTKDEQLLGDSSSLSQRFASALDSLFIAFQPIVSAKERRVIAYEALLRTDEPSLRTPVAFITAAERVGRIYDLGRKVRDSVAAAATELPLELELFVNLHPSDMMDPDLIKGSASLSRIASRVVLEITERASLAEVNDVAGRVAALRRTGFRVAVDDLGAGYAGLASLTSLEPDVVKIDMSLIRGIDVDLRRQRVVASLTALCQDLAMRVVVEGIENQRERDAVLDLGGDLMQGYHFARPQRGFAQVSPAAWL